MTFVPERLQRAHAFLERGVADGAYAGAVALVALHGEVAAHWAVGNAQVEPERDRRSMTPDMIFDLASLTKTVGGAARARSWRQMPGRAACSRRDTVAHPRRN